LGIGGLGFGDGAQSPIPNPQSPIPNPQSPINNIKTKFFENKLILYINSYYIFSKKMIN
jgi:hypothetical protein